MANVTQFDERRHGHQAMLSSPRPHPREAGSAAGGCNEPRATCGQLRVLDMNATILDVPELAGPRLRLRALDTRDADALFAMRADPLVMRYWSQPPWRERAQAIEYIERMQREREHVEFYPWVTALDDDVLIGTCSLFALSREHGRAEIGYALRREFWGRGLAQDMLALALTHAFDAIGLNRIEADIDPDNAASCRLAERLGFTREGLLRERWRVDGGVQDTALYGLLAREWRERTGT